MPPERQQPLSDKLRDEMGLGGRLRKLREERGYSRDDLFLLTGVGSGAIRDIEEKGAMPQANRLAALAEILEVSADYLLGRTDDPAVRESWDGKSERRVTPPGEGPEPKRLEPEDLAPPRSRTRRRRGSA